MVSYDEARKSILFIKENCFLFLVIAVLYTLYCYYTYTFDYFKKKGVPYLKPIIFFGNLAPRVFPKKSFHEYYLDIYNTFRGEQFAGAFEGRKPILYILDPNIIRAVAVRDFEYFVDRNCFESKEPRNISRCLINLKGQEWKDVRRILTPAFSSSRLKNMLPLLQFNAGKLINYLEQFDNCVVEMRDIMGKFTLEVIGACAFGIKCDAFNDVNTEFAKAAATFNCWSRPKKLWIYFLLLFMPNLIKYLNLSTLNQESIRKLLKILNVAKRERRSSGTKRNDFLQLILDAAAKEKVEAGKCSSNSQIYLDEDTIDAQSLLFLLAGYDTSRLVLSFAIYEMAINPELQVKLRAHINEVTEGKVLDIELLSRLTYLEAFLLETLRKYPPGSRLDRVCVKRYTIPGTSVTLDPGDVITIPSYGIHMDSQWYPDPQQFRPERFLGDENRNRPPHLFLAFGVGPRNCIGGRFTMLSSKLVMVALLRNFAFSVCEKTEIPMKFSKDHFLLTAQNGVWVRLRLL